MLGKFIKQLRKKNNLSQNYVAKHIGVSRPTYLQVEKGDRELTISEAQKIADLFNLSLDNILNCIDEKIRINLKKETRNSNNKGEEIRIDVPQNKADKFKEVLLYILSKVGAKPNVGLTVLYKLLYFIDFNYYEKYEEQLIGATYIKNHFGPTPIYFSKIVEDMKQKNEVEEVKSQYFLHDQKKYLPKRPADLSKLSANELQTIDQVLTQLSDKTAKELSDYSHEDVPWKTAIEGKPIDYEAVFYRTDKYSVRDYGDNKL
jgi:transcriptional regulator with XRE-family HTH domain